jgi:CD2 antigen cytoplasmic tail-binding protein 2
MTGRQAPRPKRAGEAFARAHHAENDDESTKKPRFDIRNPSALAADAPEEDAILELDSIGKGGQGTKRNAVNIDGYDSDSSNEGFDARADAKAAEAKRNTAKNRKSQDEEDADMFADLEEDFEDGDEDEDLSSGTKKKRKEVKFLEQDEIEGQVLKSKSGGHVPADFSLQEKQRAIDENDESDSDEEIAQLRAQEEAIDDEIGAGGLKTNAPKLDAFNMKDELEEGRFDTSGNFVRKAVDPDAVHDTWLEGVSKREMKKAKEAAEKREEEMRLKGLEEDQVLTSELLSRLIVNMERAETVLEALARLGKGKKQKNKPKWLNKKRSKASGDVKDDMDIEKAEDPVERRRREAVENITSAASALLSRGQHEIYDEEKEMLMRQYKRETGDDWQDPPTPAEEEGGSIAPSGDRAWQYRWTDGRDGEYGPYHGSEMKAWYDSGFFENAEFKPAEGDSTTWSRVPHF